MESVSQLNLPLRECVSYGTTIGIAAMIAASILSSYAYMKAKQSYWQRKGVKGPKPTVLLGNLSGLLLGDRSSRELKWVQKYGKVYGTYHGLSPRLVVADPEVLMRICVEDFENFTNHKEDKYQNDYVKSFPISLKDQQWKKVRSLLSPAFTGVNIKRMFKLLDSCAENLIESLSERMPSAENPTKTEIINLIEIYNLYSLNAIASCFYGLKLGDTQSTGKESEAAIVRDEFFKAVTRFSEYSATRSMAAGAIPGPILKSFRFKVAPEKSIKPLADRMSQLIDSRKQSGDKPNDYLQILMDAKLGNAKMELTSTDEQENHHVGLTNETLVKNQKKLITDAKVTNEEEKPEALKLDDDELLACGMFLLVAGLDTTATLLAQISYSLAFHSKVQQKLFEELHRVAIKNANPEKFTFNYEVLSSCKYLDAVVSETLRLLGPVLQSDRVAKEDFRIEKYNLNVKKGRIINLAYHAVMNDPDYWDKPESFIPERFMPENRDKIIPGSYCPFGLGPRHCVGMRISLTETKLALAKIMMSFRFYPAPGTVFPPATERVHTSNAIKSPLVRLVPRVNSNPKQPET